MNSKWVFSKNEIGQPPIDPKSQEKFGDYSCIFEFIQNAVDAKQDGKSPLVKIRTVNIPRNEYVQLLTTEYIKHLEASPRVKNFEEKLSEDQVETLVLEDFNTTGILGDPSVWHVTTEEEKPNPIFRFLYCIGIDAKLPEAAMGGSEGEGRQTFCHSSDISSFFAYSVKQNNKKPLLFGFSYLGTRTIGRTMFNPIAHFGNEKTTDKKIVYGEPTSEQKDIDEFRKISKILRQNSDPGTTVVIPFKNSTLTKENIIKEILQKYRVPVLRGLVSIEVEDVKINAETYDRVLKDYDSFYDLALGYSEFVKKCSVEKENTFVLKHSMALSRPPSTDDIEHFDELIKKYNNNEIIKINVPFTVTYKKALEGSYVKKWRETNTSYSVFIKKFPVGWIQPMKFNDYVRGYLPIFGLQKPLLMYCLVDAQDTEAMLFFKRAEGANHTKWMSKHPKLRFYKQGTYSKFIQYTISLPNLIYDLISFQQEEEDLTTSLPLFPIEDETGQGGDETGPQKRVSPLVVPVIFPTLAEFDFELVKEEKNHGFSLKGCAYVKKDIMKKVEEMENFIKVAEYKINESNKQDKKDEIKKTKKDISTAEKRIDEYKNFLSDGCNFYPLKIRVRAAFSMEGVSNPLKYYNPNDFNFSDRKIFKFKRKNDAEIEFADENEIVVSASSPNFNVNVSGFGAVSEEDIFIKPEVKR